MQLYKITIVLVITLIGLILNACNFQSNVEVVLPPYDNKLAVEGYIEPGKPIKILVTETKSFFDPIGIPEVRNATVIVASKGISDTLIYAYSSENDKIWNFYSDRIIDTAAGNTYTITVQDDKGRKVSASDNIPQEPEILSYTYDFNETDNVAMKIVLAKTDEPAYYRVLYHNDSIIGAPVQSYLFEDFTRRNPQTGNIEIKTPYRWRRGEVCVVRIFKLSKAYFSFLNSVEQAKSINGNPFVQPTQVISNVKDGFGIFAAVRYKQIKFNFN
jgi:hypothetical protein